MHLRINRTKRGDRTYEYAQLVESIRRPDGVPTHRVIATLGALSTLEVDNLRAALGASRDRRRVVVAPVARASVAPDVLANLRYLDVAVPLELWRQWGLAEIIAELMPAGEADVSPASVVAALVLQRLVDPGSKLAATTWFPRSALPELLDVDPSSFNNTRLHRVLDELDAASNQLMSRLPRRYEEQEGAFTSLFLDVTDAAFVGHGPPQAERAKTKEGFVARKIGIVLLCNQRGYPLRWEVVSGNANDSKTMLGMMRTVAGFRWAHEAPIVCDRAMGRTATISAIAQLGLRFVTALTSIEFGRYSNDQIPCAAVADLWPTSACDAKVEVEAARRVAAAGMEQVDDNLYVQDLGIVESVESVAAPVEGSPPAQAMKLCRQMLDLVASHECDSFAEASRKLGLRESLAMKYRGLHKLVEDVQRDVLAGRADDCTLDALLALGRLPADEQCPRFEQLLAAPRRKRAARTVLATPPASPAPPLRLRVIAYFNQERFVEKRHNAQTQLAEIHEFVVDLNARLGNSRGRRTRASIEAEVDRRLRAADLLDAFTLSIDELLVEDRARFVVSLTLNDKSWARRRRYDGFTLLVAHHELTHSAAQLCRLYRAKDAVEKDFHIIKSVLALRPVRHHTESKVRAHVTLCMLALLLERTLGQRLRGHCTAEEALENLEPCRLNRFAHDTHAYGLTRPTDEQAVLLRQLGMMNLVDDAEVAERIRPR
jgi:hypothetical protein